VREAAERGEVVSILGDRVISGDRVRRCRFLGQTASFPEGPFVLAAALRAPIVLFSALRDDDGRYRIRFEPFTERIDVARSEREGALQRACQHYANWLEARCREAPYNWFNFYDFWSDSASAPES
jgi:predicted LPLAT superfamily acyltransferase